jgi:hypothetical protein
MKARPEAGLRSCLGVPALAVFAGCGGASPATAGVPFAVRYDPTG